MFQKGFGFNTSTSVSILSKICGSTGTDGIKVKQLSFDLTKPNEL